MMGSAKLDPNFLTFTKEGWVDYSPERMAPSSSYEPFWWEVIEWKYWASEVNRNPHYPFLISGVYIAIIFGIQALMKNRKPFGLKRELALWNGGLGLFSILGVVRVFPDLWSKINQPNGLYRSLCVRDDVSIPMAFWATMFVVSKIVELGKILTPSSSSGGNDRFNFCNGYEAILYHHSVSLILAWTTGAYLEPICRFYIVMNYGVHSMMYPYFALRALNVNIPKPLANMITFLQLAQMIIGVGINAYTSYLYYFFGSCNRYPFTIKMIWLAYGSFLMLFGQLFYRLVLKKNAKNGKSE